MNTRGQPDANPFQSRHDLKRTLYNEKDRQRDRSLQQNDNYAWG